jgi:hypothetical protein
MSASEPGKALGREVSYPARLRQLCEWLFSLHRKLLPVVMEFARADQSLMRDFDPVKFAFELRLPEMQEFIQDWKTRRYVEILPDIGLQQRRVVGNMINDFGRRQTVILELSREIAVNLTYHLKTIAKFP